MIFTALRITNFRSFRGTQEFVFPQGPGLYFMQGDNQAEPRLGGNGTGKSSLWEALTWLFFEKTSRGLKAGDINSWGVGKGTSVELDFTAPSGEDCTLVRTWGPNSWVIHDQHSSGSFREDLTKSQDNPVLGWLGMDYAAWLSTIFAAQRGQMFLDLGASKQAAVLSDVLGLDRWLGYADKASALETRQDAISRDLEAVLARKAGEVEALGRGSADLAAEWERVRAWELDKLGRAYEQALNNTWGKAPLKKAEEAEAQARAAYKAAGDAELKLYKALQATEGECAKRGQSIEALDERCADLFNQQRALKTETTCPTCGSRMDESHRHRSVKELAARLSALDSQLNLERDDLKALEDKRADQKALHRGAVEVLDDRRDDLREAEEATRKCRLEYDREKQMLDGMEDDIDRCKARRNPYEQDAQRLRDARDDQRDAERRLDASYYKQSLYKHWRTGFKEIRLSLIADALAELELECNSAINALGLVGWELVFAVDRETKGGSLSRGFNVLVKGPTNEKAVPWDSWSGGEAQRLRLAGNMGVADLTRSRLGVGLGLEVWDEPTQGLSPQGITDLLEALAQRARVENRQIWIVDHHSRQFGGFAGGATITKTTKGSVIKQYS